MFGRITEAMKAEVQSTCEGRVFSVAMQTAKLGSDMINHRKSIEEALQEYALLRAELSDCHGEQGELD